MTIIIERSKRKTFGLVVGILFIDSTPRFVTFENYNDLIPEGRYIATRGIYRGFINGKEDYIVVWELQNVPGKKPKIRIGYNYEDCKGGDIFIGKQFNSELVTELLDFSEKAFLEFHKITDKLDEITVIIR